jgi:hypothetical protein
MEKVKNITDIVCLTIPPREKYFKSLVSKLTSQEFKVEAFLCKIGFLKFYLTNKNSKFNASEYKISINYQCGQLSKNK